MRYNVHDITGEFATDADSGQTLYERVYPQVKAGKPVELDFEGVHVFASAFFNFAVGQLLSDLSTEHLNTYLSVQNLSPDGHSVLKRVIDNAKQYYGDRQYREAVDSVMEEYAASF
ncbi:MAG: STAS-like domain-containing protein [Leptolyngbyaceae bacterium]|nr:STAS-like domain-containing protein [Leptolyngbyaceae bacterium]